MGDNNIDLDQDSSTTATEWSSCSTSSITLTPEVGQQRAQVSHPRTRRKRRAKNRRRRSGRRSLIHIMNMKSSIMMILSPHTVTGNCNVTQGHITYMISQQQVDVGVAAKLKNNIHNYAIANDESQSEVAATTVEFEGQHQMPRRRRGRRYRGKRKTRSGYNLLGPDYDNLFEGYDEYH